MTVVNVAHQHATPLYAISRGQNWGYGGPLPRRDGMVILDLSRLDRILEVNTELGYVVLEPGVSQGQLYEYPREHNIPLIPDATGAGPDASVVGNILQRGFGHTPYGNRILHAANFEVVLPDGTVIETGFGRFPNAKNKHVFPYGVGPWLDGLFTQSLCGVVTRMTVWLLPKPEKLIGFALKVPQEADIAEIVERLRPLCMHGIVRSTVHIANDLRVISARSRYPYELTGGRTPLPPEIRQLLRRRHGIGAWNLMGGIYGTKRMARAAAADIRDGFRGLARVHFFGPRLLGFARRALDFLERFGFRTALRETVESADSVYRLLWGEPSPEHLKGVFWRHRKLPEPLDMSQAGILWCSPVVPMRGEDVQALLKVVEPVFEKHGFEPLITLSAVTSRALVGVISVCYNPEEPGEIEKAGECYKELKQAVCDAGYYPYRTMNNDEALLEWPIKVNITR